MSATEVQPAQDGVAITTSDANNLASPCRAIYVGGAGSGNLKIKTARGNDLVLTGIAVGYHPLSAQKIYATGTDVTGIVALY